MKFITPYLVKSGEKISEEIGKSLWSWIKNKLKDKKVKLDCESETNLILIKSQLEKIISNDNDFAQELLQKIANLNNVSKSNVTMIIENNSTVEKQINITNPSGPINL